MELDVVNIQVIGILLVALGLILFVAPILIQRMPDLERIPWIILYVYRSDGFTFATSPILIIVSVISLVWNLFFKRT